MVGCVEESSQKVMAGVHGTEYIYIVYIYSQKVEECSWESSLEEVMGSIEESSQEVME